MLFTVAQVQAVDSKNDLTAATASFSEYQHSKKQDKQMLAYQFQQLMSQIPEKVRKQHTINSDLISSMTSPNEHIRLNFTGRLLQACNMQMMTSSNKRAKVVQSTIQFATPVQEVEQETPAMSQSAQVEDNASVSDALLRRALTESFEVM